MSHMATIGVREMQGDARRWLARVRAGEAVVITDRGRPVAKMIPLPEAVGFDALVAEGRIAPGPGRSLDKVDLSGIVAYDERLIEAASRAGLTTASPGA